MNARNAKTIGAVERERERESGNLNNIAVLACINIAKSVLVGKLYIIYKELKINMLLIHRQTVF